MSDNLDHADAQSLDHILEVPEVQEQSTEDTQSTTRTASNAIKPTSAFFDESYTYADRDRELGLLENLLSMQLNNVRMERVLIHHTLNNQSQR